MQGRVGFRFASRVSLPKFVILFAYTKWKVFTVIGIVLTVIG